MKNLNSDSKQRIQQYKITPDKIAHQFPLNGKSRRGPTYMRVNKIHITEKEKMGLFKEKFRVEELNKIIQMLKNKNASELDDICVEQIKEFGSKTK